MQIKPEKYMRKALYVEAVQVDDSNMEDLAQWCSGRIEQTANNPQEGKVATKFIRVPMTNAFNDRQTQAFVGDWVIRSARKNFKVYTETAFPRAFDKMTDGISHEQTVS